MKRYHPRWILDYLQYNNFITISVLSILVLTATGTFCWFLLFWALGVGVSLVIYFILSYIGIFELHRLLEVKRKQLGNNKIYGFLGLKIFLLIAYYIGCIFLSAYLFLGIDLLLGGDFP